MADTGHPYGYCRTRRHEEGRVWLFQDSLTGAAWSIHFFPLFPMCNVRICRHPARCPRFGQSSCSGPDVRCQNCFVSVSFSTFSSLSSSSSSSKDKVKLPGDLWRNILTWRTLGIKSRGRVYCRTTIASKLIFKDNTVGRSVATVPQPVLAWPGAALANSIMWAEKLKRA